MTTVQKAPAFHPAKSADHAHAMTAKGHPRSSDVHAFMQRFTGSVSTPAAVDVCAYSATDYVLVLSGVCPKAVDYDRFCWHDGAIATQQLQNWREFIDTARGVTIMPFPSKITADALFGKRAAVATPESEDARKGDQYHAHFDLQLWLFHLARAAHGADGTFDPLATRRRLQGQSRQCATSRQKIREVLRDRPAQAAPAGKVTNIGGTGKARTRCALRPMPETVDECLQETLCIRGAINEVAKTFFQHLESQGSADGIGQSLTAVAEAHFPLDRADDAA